MNAITEFQKLHGADVRAFLNGPHGKAFMHILAALRPKATLNNSMVEHQIVLDHGVIGGYEKCLSNMYAVCTENLERPLPEANYGVTKKDSAE